MSCLNPQKFSDVFYPCGKCPRCRDMIRAQMAARILIEHFANPGTGLHFLTLTYSDDFYSGRFERSHIDKFLQDLRNSLRGHLSFRYLIVCDRGDLLDRCHYHCIFLTSKDLPYGRSFRSPDGHLFILHPFVDAVRSSWSYGFVDDGGVPSPAAIMYTTGYALKEDSYSLDHEDELSEIWYCIRHKIPLSPELQSVKDNAPFRRFSLRPGLGLDPSSVQWVYDYMYNDGIHFRTSISLGGLRVPVPRIYLDKFIQLFDGDTTFSYIVREMRKNQFDTDLQDSLSEAYERCPDNRLSRSVRKARINKRKQDKLLKSHLNFNHYGLSSSFPSRSPSEGSSPLPFIP